jgi:hypothetical protein
MHVLFANTGVQIVCIPLRGGSRYQTSQIGYGWQRTAIAGVAQNDPPRTFPYIQWQIIQSGTTRLFLAVETSCGDPEVGYFCSPNSLTRDFVINLQGLLDIEGKPLKGVPDVDLCIRPAAATAGEAKQVHMIIDFGNSRTGVLLLELAGEISQTPQMLPFELTNRYHLDAWNEEGEPVSQPATRWFSSKTHWCNTPYLPPLQQKKTDYHTVGEDDGKRGWFGRGGKTKQAKVEVVVTPPMFDDLSMVRLGREADDVVQVMRAEGDIRTGVSSPKRYLWADDASWLEGANWHMADPSDRCRTGAYSSPLKGPFLKYNHEDDRDFLLEENEPREEEYAAESPLKPRHAPRVLMTAALHELLCQAYTYVNSPAYRNSSGEAGRAREIRTLTLSYPSGMIQEEQHRLAAQGNKAINIFYATLGKNQRCKPELNLGIDEASACHLTYIWSELRMLGQDPRLWFTTMRQDRGKKKPKVEDMPEVTAARPATSRRAMPRPGAPRPSAPMRGKNEPETFGDEANEIRIACIDIGGGTTDLMIAKYNFESKIDDYIRGQVLHQDGISLGGDQLVKRLLETIIVPAFADSLGLEEEDVQVLFGPEVPRNRELRAQRVNWMNRLFVPLAQAYLQNASDDVTEPITHTDPGLVDPVVVDSLQRAFDKLRGPGYYNAQQELNLVYDKLEFEGVVYDTFADLLYDFCHRIVEHETDVVILAGLPSKLGYIQDLVKMYVPLSPSRIVPMHNHYAGNWYPYQDEKGHNPGVIIDPKSPVVVGAAIEFMARHGMLPQFKFDMKGRTHENTYYWGVMTDATSGIRRERILFEPVTEQSREDVTEFQTSSQRVLIGRKGSGDEGAQATPVYLLKIDPGDRIGPTQISVKVKRKHATKDHEEVLEVDQVTGVVAGEDAILGENVFFSWRTLADERYYLDTGGLDNIEVGKR